MMARLLVVAVTTSLVFAVGVRAQSVDAAAAEALVKKSKCTT